MYQEFQNQSQILWKKLPATDVNQGVKIPIQSECDVKLEPQQR